jgi:hypothetical protein
LIQREKTERLRQGFFAGDHGGPAGRRDRGSRAIHLLPRAKSAGLPFDERAVPPIKLRQHRTLARVFCVCLFAVVDGAFRTYGKFPAGGGIESAASPADPFAGIGNLRGHYHGGDPHPCGHVLMCDLEYCHRDKTQDHDMWWFSPDPGDLSARAFSSS